MRQFIATAGNVYISDVSHYLNATVGRDGFAQCEIVRVWDYSKQQPYPKDQQPRETITARSHGRGVRYFRNGRSFLSCDFVRVIGGLQ